MAIDFTPIRTTSPIDVVVFKCHKIGEIVYYLPD